jgi:hypothetical protein
LYLLFKPLDFGITVRHLGYVRLFTSRSAFAKTFLPFGIGQRHLALLRYITKEGVYRRSVALVHLEFCGWG